MSLYTLHDIFLLFSNKLFLFPVERKCAYVPKSVVRMSFFVCFYLLNLLC